MEYKLLVSDIDGTLINDNQEITEKNKKAVINLMESGYNFCFATGRMLESVTKYAKIIQPNTPSIIYNGTQIINLLNNKILFEKKINKEILIRLMKINKQFNFQVLVYYQNNILIEKMNETVEKYMNKKNINCVLVDSIIEKITNEFTKILLIGDPKKMIKYQEVIRKNFSSSEISVLRSEETYLEILPPNISKGTALNKLSKITRISLKNIIAIGDNLNDIELLKNAGMGVATKNAHPKLKKYADYITESDNNDANLLEVTNKFFQL